MLTLVVLALATYRVARFLINDTLIDRPRLWMFVKLSAHPKLLELANCPWCLSVWIAGAATIMAEAVGDVPLPLLFWPAVSGLAMIVWHYVEVDETISIKEAEQ